MFFHVEPCTVWRTGGPAARPTAATAPGACVGTSFRLFVRMAFVTPVLDDYLNDLRDACGGGQAGPRPAEFDNTKHVGSCSLAATPAVLGVLMVLCILRRILCKEKLRQTYSGSEDAPELEEIVATSGNSSRRVESYSSRHGRLVTNAGASRSGGSSSSSSTGKAPRPKAKRGAASAELEPVLWRRG